MKDQDIPLPSEAVPHAHYMRPLDGLRGLACLIVVALHIIVIQKHELSHKLYDFGGMGVTIFFALSGFLMATLYCDKKFSLDTSAKYMIARMSRIAPAYWIAVAFAWCLYMVMPDGFKYEMTPIATLRAVFFAGNVDVFWSIPPEIQFYVFFIPLWFSYERTKAGNYWWAIAMGVPCLVFISTRDLWGGLMLPSKLHIFLGGFLVALLIKSERTKRYLCNNITQIALTSATALYGISCLEVGKIYDDLIISTLVALTVGSLSRSSNVTVVLETQTMRLIGAASFSIYLFHNPILYTLNGLGVFSSPHRLINTILMCIISLAIPVAFHFMAEKRLNILAREKGMTAFEWLKTKWPLKGLVPAGN